MAYIESHQELARHPKTKKAARKLGISIPTMIGHLHLLWWWCVDYAEDGNLTKFDAEDIAEAALWEGDAETFLEALVACGTGGGAGFIDVAHVDGAVTLHIHDWYEYTGMLIERREKNRDRMRAARAKTKEQDVHARVAHMDDTCGATVPNPTVPNPTQPNLSLPRARVREDTSQPTEEREREDSLPDGLKDDEAPPSKPTSLEDKLRRNTIKGALMALWGQPDKAEQDEWEDGVDKIFADGYTGDDVRRAIPLFEQRRSKTPHKPYLLAKNMRSLLSEGSPRASPAPAQPKSSRHQPSEEEIAEYGRALQDIFSTASGG